MAATAMSVPPRRLAACPNLAPNCAASSATTARTIPGQRTSAFCCAVTGRGSCSLVHRTGSPRSKKSSRSPTARFVSATTPRTPKAFVSTRSSPDGLFAPGSQAGPTTEPTDRARRENDPASVPQASFRCQQLGVAYQRVRTRLTEEGESTGESSCARSGSPAASSCRAASSRATASSGCDPMAAYSSAARAKSASMTARAASYHRVRGVADSSRQRSSAFARRGSRRAGPEATRRPRTAAPLPAHREAPRQLLCESSAARAAETRGAERKRWKQVERLVRRSCEFQGGLGVFQSSVVIATSEANASPVEPRLSGAPMRRACLNCDPDTRR